jgi:CheY-like chemotaxis protein
MATSPRNDISNPEAVPVAKRETKLGKKSDTALLLDKQPLRPVRSLRVLIVDDDADTASTLAMLLDLLNHEVCAAYDGPTALEVVRTFRPDVILLDIALARGMNGYQVARQLRNQAEFQEIILIAMTGYAQEKDRQEAFAAGFDHHLAKPFGLEELKGLLATAKPIGQS